MPDQNTGQDSKQVEQQIRNATVKITVDGTFRGTGFFISRAGYVLTAYHCIGIDEAQGSRAGPAIIELETPFDGMVPARLEPDKSLPAYDLAILKPCEPPGYQPSHCLPLGIINSDQISDPVVTIGYPASHLDQNQEVGTYKGHISRWRDDSLVELSDAIKGRGHSGGSVYHYDSGRVVGVVTDRYKEGIMADAGLATRLERLFEKWPELTALNQATATLWDQQLQALHRTEGKHPIVLAMLPEGSGSVTLLAALRTLFEDQWGCQVLTVQDRQYSASILENLRIHLEQAAIFVAEVSVADPDVMFMLGAAQLGLSHVPIALLSQGQEQLPQPLRGRVIVGYEHSAANLVTQLDQGLSRLAPLQQLLNDPQREHFLSISRLQEMSRLWLDEKIWQQLQERYSTEEAWQGATISTLASLLGTEADLASVLLNRIGGGIR